MERLVSPLRRWMRKIMEMPTTVLLRKLESTFYLLFFLLVVACFTNPLVDDIKKAPLYMTAAFSVAYGIGFHFLRFNIPIHFRYMLHSGVFKCLLSTIFFESGHKKVGTAMIGIGILCFLIILVFVSSVREVIVRNVVEQQEDQPDVQEDQPDVQEDQPDVQEDQPVHHAIIWNNRLILNRPHVEIIDRPRVLVNEVFIHPIPAFANRIINHFNQNLANGLGNAILENGHAIQPREDQVEEAG